MAGRSGMGLASGFIQGFELADRADKRERSMGLQEAQNARAQETQGWQRERMDKARQDWQREDDGRLVLAMQQGVETGELDPKLAQEFGRRFDVDWSNYVNPEFGSSLEVLSNTAAGKGSMRSPEFNKAFETVFRTEINKGTGEEYQGADGAHRLEQKRLAGVYPGRDGKTLMVDLEVLDKGPGGEEWRRAPVTENRSAKDEHVKAIPLEAALQKLKGHQLMFQAVQSSPELQSVIRQHAARTGVVLPKADTSDSAKKMKELVASGMTQEEARKVAYGIKANDGRTKGVTINDRLVDPYTGKEMANFSDPASSSNKAPADVQTAEWMVKNKMAANLDEAFSRVSESRTDPTRFVSDFVSQELKVQEAAGIYPDDENYRGTEELRNQAIDVLKTIRSRSRGTAEPEQKGRIAPSPASEGNVYTGTVDRSGGASTAARPDGVRRLELLNPENPAQSAPAAAVAHLRNNPDLAPQFQAKYGYLPEGM